MFLVSRLGIWRCHDIWILDKLKFDDLNSKKSFRSEIKTFFLLLRLLSIRDTKQTSKSVVDTNFKLPFRRNFKNFIQVVRTVAINKFKDNNQNNTLLINPALTCNQFKSLIPLWEIVYIISNWQQKQMHLSCINWSFFFSFCVKFGHHVEHG